MLTQTQMRVRQARSLGCLGYVHAMHVRCIYTRECKTCKHVLKMANVCRLALECVVSMSHGYVYRGLFSPLDCHYVTCMRAHKHTRARACAHTHTTCARTPPQTVSRTLRLTCTHPSAWSRAPRFLFDTLYRASSQSPNLRSFG
jgi:hypothetical protein